MTLYSKTAVKGSLVGALTGYFILHPVSMVIISHTMPGSMPGMSMDQGIMSILMEAIMAHHMWMSLYFTLLGASFGFSAGILYARILGQTEELHCQKLVIEETLIEKDTLLRILSHDLSNQICASSGFAEILLLDLDKLKEDEREMVGSIKTSLDLATNLINFSKTLIGIESGKISMSLVEKDVRKAIWEIIPTFKVPMEKKGLSFSTNFGDNPVFIQVEPNIFCHTIMGNLISNAIKFSTPNQSIGISIKQDAKNVQISVSNDGPGMTKTKIDTIFSIKNRTTTPGTMGEMGTGLGLPLVFKFVKLMCGEISVSSKVSLKNPNVSTTVFALLFPSVNQKAPDVSSDNSADRLFSQPSPIEWPSLVTLPRQLLKAMQQAVVEGDMEVLTGLIAQVKKVDNDAAGKLQKLANHYDYEKLMAWLERDEKKDG